MRKESKKVCSSLQDLTISDLQELQKSADMVYDVLKKYELLGGMGLLLRDNMDLWLDCNAVIKERRQKNAKR